MVAIISALEMSQKKNLHLWIQGVCIGISEPLNETKRTSFYNGRLVTGADWQNFENAACGPQQFFIGVSPHDVDQRLGASAGQDYQLHKKRSNQKGKA